MKPASRRAPELPHLRTPETIFQVSGVSKHNEMEGEGAYEGHSVLKNGSTCVLEDYQVESRREEWYCLSANIFAR
jgi:hypothetical protein